ncbi:hypothetical protein ACFWBB_01010 [Streptomyces sp. NPDC060000]|uniref:hypothetical protein n=1 Tax=Streptomyces sp. NPDC060000 TaxID=3347031 RepID=UPI0036A7DCFD
MSSGASTAARSAGLNTADISTNDSVTSTDLMLLGLTVLAPHVAGIGIRIGSGWSVRGRRR